MLMTINFSERALFGHSAEDNKFVTRANDAILLKLGVLLWNGGLSRSLTTPSPRIIAQGHCLLDRESNFAHSWRLK
jgi:hypothetical protein